MRYIILVTCIVFMSSSCFGLSLTQEQFDNLEYIDKQIKAKYPQFKGFNGSKDDMKFVGISETAMVEELANINLDSVGADKYEEEQETKLIREKIIDMAITSIEKGRTLKHKAKIRKKLLKQ